MALGCLILGILGAVGACGSGDECVGGVKNEETGLCEGKCQPDKCLEGNTCAGNRCVLVCDSHLDCFLGTQDCAGEYESGAPVVDDETGAPIFACVENGKDVGYGQACPFGTECGNFGKCPDGTGCSTLQCGGNPDACVRNVAVCGDDESCAVGTCPDGAPCTVAKCPAIQCTVPFSCTGAGEGDADAYCTKGGCQADTDCPGGFECGITRYRHNICGMAEAETICGVIDGPCVDPMTLTGAGLIDGTLCKLQQACIKRTQCAPCATDLDCSTIAGQRCVAIGGESRCARTCGVDADCDPDYRCDTGACMPRFGACKGQGNFCEPCQNDLDCGEPGSSKICAELSGGQHACFDYSFPDPCETNADCPVSPGGKRGECLDENEGVDPSSGAYHHCFLPYNVVDNKFGCW